MIIKGKQEVEVEISEAQRYLIAVDYICEKFKWDSDYFIEDGWVINVYIMNKRTEGLKINRRGKLIQINKSFQ